MYKGKFNMKTKKHQLGYQEIIDKPNQNELDDYYQNKYYQESISKSYAHSYKKQELEFIKNKLKQKFKIVKDNVPDGKSFLDVGCGEGFALSYFFKEGYTVKGIDYSSAGVKKHNPDCLGFLASGDLFGLLEKEIINKNKYDVIWLQNVLEHVLEPIELLNNLKEIVSENGLVVVTIPNDFSKLQEYALELGLIEHEYWVAPPDHISYFNTENIENVIKKTGWILVDKLADFPIDWFVFHENSNYIKNKNVGKSAHNARVMLEGLISKNDIYKINNFYRSLAELGMGRDVTVMIRKFNVFR